MVIHGFRVYLNCIFINMIKYLFVGMLNMWYIVTILLIR